MSEWTSGKVIANGITIHYHRTGGDKPSIVLSHGITDNGLCWTHVAQALEADYDLVMYDARGHGLSDAPEQGHSPQVRAADLAGLIHALGLGTPCLIGHSMGAATTAVAAARYPDFVRCAILEDPPWRPVSEGLTEEMRRAGAEQWRAQVIEQKAMTRAQLVAFAHRNSPAWPEAELGPWADAKRQVSLDVFEGMTGPRTPWQELAREIRCPVLLITGDPEMGAVVTPQVATEAVDLWEAGEVAHIPGAGHSIHREQYQAYIRTVRAFLDKVLGN